MKVYLSLEATLRIMKVATSPMLGWPLSPESKRIAVLRRQILMIGSMVNSVSIIPAMVLNMYNNRGDHLNIFLNCTDMIGVCAQIMFFFACYFEANRLNALITETKKFSTKATNEELAVIQFFMRKCSLLHVTVLVVCVFGVTTYIVAPVVISQPLPIKAAYPFSIEPLWISAFLYCSHSIVVAQIGTTVCMTITSVAITWFGVARFGIVCMNIQRATNVNEVNKCIRQHLDSLDFADRLSTTVDRMAVVIAASNFLGVTFGGLAITYRQFYSIDFAKLMLFVAVATVHLFLYAWPADYLTRMSQQVSESILYGQWVGNSPRMHSSVLIMMLRANDPAVIKVDGLLPALNLESFGSGLSTSFSYIATLLAIFDG